MTSTVETTNAHYVTHYIERAKFALTDRNEVVWHRTKFDRYGGVEAGDVAMAGMCEGFGWLNHGGDADAVDTLWFARKREIAQRLEDAQTAGRRLKVVEDWLFPSGRFFGAPRAGIDRNAVAALDADLDDARKAFETAKAEAEAEFEAAAQRFAAAVGGDFEAAKLQEAQIIS